MGVNDRIFDPPAADLAKIDARLRGLTAPLPAWIRQAGDALVAGDLRVAQVVLANALARAPTQPDVLRLYGSLLAQVGNLAAARANFEAVLRAAPDDAMGYWQYAQVCENAGDICAAWRLREQAVQRIPDSPMAWADLGEHLTRHQQPEEAVPALERATQLAPDYAPGQLTLGNALVSCGRAEEGAAAMRKAIALEPAFGAAWLSLVDIKTVRVTRGEAGQMRALLRGAAIGEGERTAIEFALGKACEDQRQYGEAFELLVDANARRKRELCSWDSGGFVAQEQRSENVFGAPHAVAKDTRLGEHAIFIVGMPRSGTTLIEQILASHGEVQGAGELGEVAQILTEESSRRQQRYPAWVPDASAQDWQRLGQRYLELTARFRRERPRFTDKMPNNWRAIGAIRAMLPGARIVICRRDPLENCWSCFKQFFTHGWEFTYDIDHLALFWKAFDRAASRVVSHGSANVRAQGYEALTENPEIEIRALLEFCGLPFDPACFAFHQGRRAVHTLSAAQVRQPMRRHAGTAAAYGTLLDPLRSALGLRATTAADA